MTGSARSAGAQLCHAVNGGQSQPILHMLWVTCTIHSVRAHCGCCMVSFHHLHEHVVKAHLIDKLPGIIHQRHCTLSVTLCKASPSLPGMRSEGAVSLVSWARQSSKGVLRISRASADLGSSAASLREGATSKDKSSSIDDGLGLFTSSWSAML